MEVRQTDYIRWVPAPRNIKRIGKVHALLYAATGGLIGRRVDGLDILLLTTKGHRSGRLRTVPLPYFRLAGQTVVVASYGGHARDPAWLRNIRQEPQVQVQRGFRRSAARARILLDAERAGPWAELSKAFPRYAGYQERTARQIPLVVLETCARR